MNHLATHPHSGSLPHSAEWNWKSTIALQWDLWIDALSVKSCCCTWSLSPSAMCFQRGDQDWQGLILKPKTRLGFLAPQNVPFGQGWIAEFSVWPWIKEKPLLVIYPSILYTPIFVLKEKKDNRMIKKIFHSLEPTTWQDNLLKSKPIQSHIVWAIRHQVASLTVCVPPQWIGLFHWIQWIGWLL